MGYQLPKINIKKQGGKENTKTFLNIMQKEKRLNSHFCFTLNFLFTFLFAIPN